jgi:hypothetical protein
MATPNYAFAKRQKELAKKAKKEEKARLKALGIVSPPDGEEDAETDAEPANADATPTTPPPKD